MNVIPAKVAGGPDRMTTPPGKWKNLSIHLVAAKEAGADEIYKVGGTGNRSNLLLEQKASQK